MFKRDLRRIPDVFVAPNPDVFSLAVGPSSLHLHYIFIMYLCCHFVSKPNQSRVKCEERNGKLKLKKRNSFWSFSWLFLT